MNFTNPQIIVLALGIMILYTGIDGGMSGTLLAGGFCIICIALCYRNWWSDEQKKYDKTVG